MAGIQHYATYPLAADGTIQNWLACGTVTSPLEHLDTVISPDGSPFGKSGRWVLNYWAWDERSKAVKKQLYDKLPPFTWQPGILPVLHAPGIDGKQWEYAVAGEDQVIDFSRFNFTPTLMQGWCFALLRKNTHKIVRLNAELITIGPARIFLNGDLHTHYAKEFSYVAVQRIPVKLTLRDSINELYLQGDMLAWREARLALGLRFLEPAPVTIELPLGDVPAEKWHRAENGLAALQVKQFAFTKLPGHIWLGEAAKQAFGFEAEVGLPRVEQGGQSSEAALAGKAHLTLKPGEAGTLPIVPEVTAGMSGMPGENSLLLRLRPDDGTPLEIHREIWSGKNQFSREPYGDYDSRRQEAIAHLANMPDDVLASIAAVSTGKSDTISSKAVAIACHYLENRQDCADFFAIALLALLYRYGSHAALKKSDRQRIEAAFLGFKYWLDEPGLDAMCYFTENHQVLFQVAGYLAGQFWKDEVFSNSGRTGREQMKRMHPRIEDWILRRLRGNFSEWDSNAYMTLDAFAMLALVEFADSPRLQEMATTMLHKIFFLLASQSFRGAHGSTHGRCYVTGLKSSRVENTSSLQRIAWGMGIFNGETRATGLLALAQKYQVPSVLQKIGADVNSVVITKARSREKFRLQFDMRDDEWDVTTLTYRAPEVMLSAALDYRPGEFGIQEHLWQATLSPEAVIFTTYPGNSQEHGNARPNFWAGSASLPRVGMVDKTVICLYKIEQGVGLELTHAYFPAQMFDETLIEGAWAFARCGEGYVALRGDGDLILTKTGAHAFQELRSSGDGEAWICQVGRAADDGDFAAFCDSVKRHEPQFKLGIVSWVTPQGKEIMFNWWNDLKVNGTPENWKDFPHHENAYTHTPMNAATMVITHADETLTLDLARGKAY